MIDFAQLTDSSIKLIDLSQRVSRADLRHATKTSIRTLVSVIEQADDAMITFVPHDPDANDPFAAPEEQHVGWTLGHLVAHVTATSEEAAAMSSLLARGVPFPRDLRLRYETPWRDIDTQAKALRRLHESLRIRLGYLATFPDKPNRTLLRDLSERAHERLGDLNAPATFLNGLRHEAGHYAQFRESLRQAQAARELALAGD
jgi:hypothetical protein